MALRLAYRTLRRSPWFTLTAVATVALTIALASTIFAVVDGVLFRPLPYPEAERLFTLTGSAGAGGSASLSSLDVQYLRDADPRIGVTATGRGFPFTFPDQPGLRVWSLGVDPHFFDVLGRRPLIGGFRPQDFAAASGDSGTVTPAIVSFAFWQQWLGSDPSAVGRTIPMLGRTLVVTGILPRDFVIPTPTVTGQVEILTPLAVPPGAEKDRWARLITAIARVPASLSPAQAKGRLDSALAAHVNEYPPRQLLPGPYVAVAMRSLEGWLGRDERPWFRAAFGVTSLLILIGAINVAALGSARFRNRATELSIRSALGAGRRNLVTLLLGEALLISIAGAALGVSIARSFLVAAVSMLSETVLLLKTPEIDWRVIVFALLAAVLPVLLFALLPAVASTHRTHRTTTIAPTSATAWRGQGALLATESALGIVLLMGGALLLSSFVTLKTEDPGLDAQGLAVLELQTTTSLTPDGRTALHERALQLLSRLPDVSGVAAIQTPVLEGLYGGSMFAAPPGARRVMASDVPVSAAFFEMAGLRLLDGRLPTRQEIESANPVAVVSEGVAQAYWPDGRAIGQVLTSSTLAPVTVIGVIRDVRLGALSDPGELGEIFLPWAMGRDLRTVYLLRVNGDTDEIIGRAALTLRSNLPGAVPRRIESFTSALGRTIRIERLRALLFGLAGAAGLLLLAVGISGTVSMSVSRRVREIGVRTALGAQSRQLVGMMVIDHVRPAVAGAIVGLVASWWMSRLVSGFLYEIRPHEPAVWTATTVTLLLVAVFAAWIPARRASRVDPMTALRAD